MPVDALKSLFQVGPPESLYQYTVLLHNIIRRAAFPHGLHYEPRHIVTYHAPERAQLRNAEEFNDRGVELHIFFHEFDGIVFHLFHLVRDGHKLAGEHLRALGGDYLSHDERLDHLAQQEELILVVGIDLGDDDPPMLAPQHPALLRKAFQRVAYRGAADPHFGGKRPVHQLIAGSQLAVDYLLFYRFVDVIGKTLRFLLRSIRTILLVQRIRPLCFCFEPKTLSFKAGLFYLNSVLY